MILTGFQFRCILLFIFLSNSGLNGQTVSTVSPVQGSAASSSNTQVSNAQAVAVSDDDPLKGRRIVCLYNHKQFYKQGFKAGMIDPLMCTHINYEFAILNNKTYEMMAGEPDVDIKLNMYDEAVGLKKVNPKLKVMLSLGGWEDSTKKYSDMVAAGVRVANFINKAVDFLQLHGFDGLDVAWEYPNCWKGAIGIHPADKENFVQFLEKLRKRFDKENLILSVSVGSIAREITAAYNVPVMSRSVHHINVMTYDMHGPWEKVTGHHTQFDHMPGDEDPFCNSKAAIQKYIDLGADKRKLNLGLATYAKTFTLADPKKHGLHASARGAGRPGYNTKQSGYLCYFEICQYLNAGNWTEAEHKEAGFYAFSGDQWACYDPPMMVVKKAKWVIDSGIGGVLLKEMSCDDHKGLCFSMPYPLTKMLRMEMLHRLKKMT